MTTRRRSAAAVRAAVGPAVAVFVPTVASAQSPPESVEYYATDAIGSVRFVFDATGMVVGRSDYLPFGGTLNQAGNLPHQRFTGQERDGEAGMDYFNARSFQTRTGRFNRPDPLFGDAITDPQQWNRYSYVRSNPLVLTDPSGMTADPAGAAGCTTGWTREGWVSKCPPGPVQTFYVYVNRPSTYSADAYRGGRSAAGRGRGFGGAGAGGARDGTQVEGESEETVQKEPASEKFPPGRVVNESASAIPIKPENGDGTIILCRPGQVCKADGFYDYECKTNPLKIVNGTTVTFPESGAPEWNSPWYATGGTASPFHPKRLSKVGQAIAGWAPVPDGFFHEHPDWVRPNGLPGCGVR
jgi:RHS repeat-associated protein